MPNKALYEKRILNEIRSMPEEALPKIVRLLTLIKEEFMDQDTDSKPIESDINHENTRQLLAASKGNWAQDIIADREDRI